MHKMALNLCSTVMQISENSHYNKTSYGSNTSCRLYWVNFWTSGLGRTRIRHMGMLQNEDFSEEYKIKGSFFFFFWSYRSEKTGWWKWWYGTGRRWLLKSPLDLSKCNFQWHKIYQSHDLIVVFVLTPNQRSNNV